MTHRALKSIAARAGDGAMADLAPPATVRGAPGPDLAEGDIVRAIIAELGRMGYEVLEIGQLKARGSGTTVGTPDLFFRRSGWPMGTWCAMEAKTAAGRVRPEQQALHERGGSFVVRSVDSALCSMRTFELSIGEDAGAQKVERRIQIMRGGAGR